MRKIKKILVAIAAGVVIINTFNTASVVANAAAYNTDNDVCVPYADRIETKWRVSQGKLQYRRWNVTRGYWVDPEWITYVYKG